MSPFITFSLHTILHTIFLPQDINLKKPSIKSHKFKKGNFSITVDSFFNMRSITYKIFQLKALLHSQDFTCVFITVIRSKLLYPVSFQVDCNLFCILVVIECMIEAVVYA